MGIGQELRDDGGFGDDVAVVGEARDQTSLEYSTWSVSTHPKKKKVLFRTDTTAIPGSL